MKLKELKAIYVSELASIYDEDEAYAIFLITIEHFLNFSRSKFSLKKEEEVSEDNKIKIIFSVLNELKKGTPIQYILGETVFFGLSFKVNSSVLIPRPETEELVAWVIEKVNISQLTIHNPQLTTVLDIGTGSGCIAISLKKNLPQVEVTALDVSREALATARQNASLNGVEIVFIEEDILTPSNFHLPFSIIVSNPPYITQTEKEDMHQNVLANEPHLALFVSNEKPLMFYEAIADFSKKNLKENGLLFFEINEYLGKEMVAMLAAKGFNNIELRKDMQGKDRMICCHKP